MEKYRKDMTSNEISMNSTRISEYFKKKSGDWTKADYSGLTVILSFSDATYYVDDEGTIYYEYVPTFD